MLDLLREREVAAAGEIAAHFRRVSRPAISRHLRVLRECGVVTTHRRGKTQNYALNPEPLLEVREGWLRTFAKMHTDSLSRLRRIAESADPPADGAV
ncbi:MAG: ArsR family transcriptional regulator [Dehalococcoidia bacterium]|nr:ArsR family transcriptional regulator [Dehalococcoidia bacterium]